MGFRAYAKKTLGKKVEISLVKYPRSVIEAIEIPTARCHRACDYSGNDEPESQRGEPEVERRLLEIGPAVHVGDDPVVAAQHLLRDRGVEPVVGIEERQADEERKTHDQQEDG